jgi:dienelactone hydrolase
MKHILVISSLIFLVAGISCAQSTKKTITFKSTDGLLITGDLYLTTDKDAPFIILYHQARYSRGEYQEIAPKLNAMGFNCLAIDQRSGDAINGVINETHQRASEAGMATKYQDAWPDIESAFYYVTKKLKASKVIIWGSSYSAAMVFVLGSEHKARISGILAFAPGEYFKIDDKSISDYAKEINYPVFITSAKSEEQYWRPIYEKLNTDEKYFYLPQDEGYHGSKALWEENEGNDMYWKAVVQFLEQIR